VSTSAKHVVVDGSNIATEGRTIPSLDQLESAVAEIRKDVSEAEVTVVVDATFAHRIDPSELSRFEAAALRGEYVSPPAGAIGRGDAFLLRIAEKVNATVLSNDSFQEFHGEHPWLFETGRLLGATPVPGVGWIFVPRTPVRGPKSRVAVREASKAKTRVVQAVAAATAEATGDEPTPPNGSRRGGRRGPAVRTNEGEGTAAAPMRRPEAVNAPMPFITFIAEHPLGASVDGLVDSFTSHGAVVIVGDVRCYVPLSGLADPAPRSAREVLTKGARQVFLVTALDPARRGIELALPGIGVVRGVPSEETVAAEVAMTRPSRRSRSGVEKTTSAPTTPESQSTVVEHEPRSPRRRRASAPSVSVESPTTSQVVPAKKSAAKKTAAMKKAAAKVVTSSTSAAAVSARGAKQGVAKQGAAKKAAPKKVAAKKAAPERAATKKAAPAKKLAPTKTTAPTRSAAPQALPPAPAKKVAAKKTAAPQSSEGPRRSGRSRV
jgi:hypothetical protein